MPAKNGENNAKTSREQQQNCVNNLPTLSLSLGSRSRSREEPIEADREPKTFGSTKLFCASFGFALAVREIPRNSQADQSDSDFCTQQNEQNQSFFTLSVCVTRLGGLLLIFGTTCVAIFAQKNSWKATLTWRVGRVPLICGD